MNTNVVIKVTQDDINNGKPASCGNCPVAQAIKRKYKLEDPNVSVGDSFIWIKGKKYFTSNEVYFFIGKFDSGLPVKPFEFVLVGAPAKAILPF